MRFILLPLIVALSAGYMYAAATTGVCSFYSRSLDGHPTAGGDKSVVVTVNDGGALVKGRELSVTGRATEELVFIKEGLAKERIEQVQ